MPNIDSPFGFIPVARLDGSKIPVWQFPVDASNDTNMFVGDMVGAEADGGLEVADAGEDDSALGAVVALYDTDGIPIGSPGAAVTSKYLPSSTAGYADVALMLPDSVFKVQASSGTALAATDIFNGVDIVATAGDTTTAVSKMEANSTVTTDGQFKIIGKVEEPSNTWAEHVDLLVVPQLSYWFDGTAGV